MAVRHFKVAIGMIRTAVTNSASPQRFAPSVRWKYDSLVLHRAFWPYIAVLGWNH